MIKIQENTPLGKKTTFEIGGNARYFVAASSENDIREALMWARGKNIPHVILAGGSNVLIPDDGLEGLVIHIESKKWNVSGVMLQAEAGCNVYELIQKTDALGLGGWEKLAGIPGSLGGAIRGNAGAFGSEIKDFVTKVRTLNAHTFNVKEFSNVECEFSYRQSYFKKHPEWIVLDAELNLIKGDAKKFLRAAHETVEERERRHIQNVRAAGSFFMNPVASQDIRELFQKEKGVQSRGGRVPAGWLIEKAGMKGSREGGAEASMQHPNYLVNTGAATARDVRELAKKIKHAVREKFGIELVEEAVVL